MEVINALAVNECEIGHQIRVTLWDSSWESRNKTSSNDTQYERYSKDPNEDRDINKSVCTPSVEENCGRKVATSFEKGEDVGSHIFPKKLLYMGWFEAGVAINTRSISQSDELYI